jgi:hypothetical protein
MKFPILQSKLEGDRKVPQHQILTKSFMVTVRFQVRIQPFVGCLLNIMWLVTEENVRFPS